MTHPQPEGFLALPATGKGPGVLVLHAWWGLNGTIKDVCTRLAESGFVAFAPDLYHGKVADSIADAETLGNALDTNHLKAKAEIAEAVRFLNERFGQGDRGLAVIGFSMGAYYALDVAAAYPGGRDRCTLAARRKIGQAAMERAKAWAMANHSAAGQSW